jgi:hypothetical protein
MARKFTTEDTEKKNLKVWHKKNNTPESTERGMDEASHNIVKAFLCVLCG